MTPSAEQTAASSIVLADAKKQSCYLLGPTLLTGRHVRTADAVFDSNMTAWVVNVHFGTDDFVQKVGSVEVNKQVAIIVDGVVESAPTVNPGVTGRDVEIAGEFGNEDAARRIAAIIDPSSVSRTRRHRRPQSSTSSTSVAAP